MLRKTITTLATTLAAIAALFLVVKVVAEPTTTAQTEAAKASVQNALSIYDLHVNYPTIRALAAQKAPLP